MPLKGTKKKRSYGDQDDPYGFHHQLAHYQQWLDQMHYSETTIKGCESYLWKFFSWCDAHGIVHPAEVDRGQIERFQRWLYYSKTPTGSSLRISTQTLCLSHLRSFYKWMVRTKRTAYNPAADLEMPRQEKHLPQNIFSPLEIEQVLNEADTGKPLGVRDRAILEMLYSTGMRRRELVKLRLYDVNLEERVVFINQGKGNKDRYIPIGARAIAWLEKYLNEVRPGLAPHPDEGVIFLSGEHRAFNPDALGTVVRQYIVKAGIGKAGSCHVFRHSMATAMLENGADIRYIQHMLGHSRLDTTQIYTHVSIQKLKEVHQKTHPARRFRQDQEEAIQDES